MVIFKSLPQIYSMLRFDPRLWQVLEMRVDKLMTLEEIGVHFNVTRERIRQIERRAWDQFNKHKVIIAPIFDLLERNFKQRCESREDLVSITTGILIKNDCVADKSDIEKFILLTRALVLLDPDLNKSGYIEKHWPQFSYFACKIEPPVIRHYKAAEVIEEEKERNRKLSYKEIAYKILHNEGQPLHWLEIANRAYHLRRRDTFNSTALYNTLMNHPQIFVRVDSGTYALVEWGLSQVDTYPDIIASILKTSKKPLSADAIYHRVNEIRQVKKSTLIMSLEMHPRFYKSLQKTYGLRAWLPPREKQTLRTPEWLVEDRESYKRLEQASQRGYNIENMIREDLESN
jgi:transcriptional regulator/DNA-directed RNA polymerase delta subunit